MTNCWQKLRVLCAFLVVVALIGCGHKAGWLTSCGSYIAKSDQEAEAFENSLSHWLETNGFLSVQDPGGAISLAGSSQPGLIAKMYRGSYRDSPSFVLRVLKFPLNGRPKRDDHPALTQYDFDCTWEVYGSEKYVAEMETLTTRFAKEFASWLEEQNAPPN